MGLHTGRSKGRCIVVYKNFGSGRPCEGEIPPLSRLQGRFKTNLSHNNLHSASLRWNLHNWWFQNRSPILQCSIFRFHSLNFGKRICPKNWSKAGGFSPTHLENIFIKLDHFPRDQVENKNHIWNHQPSATLSDVCSQVSSFCRIWDSRQPMVKPGESFFGDVRPPKKPRDPCGWKRKCEH